MATTFNLPTSSSQKLNSPSQIDLVTSFATAINTLEAANTGDQTTIVGITGTMAQFDTACSDGNFVYQGGALGTPSSGVLTNCTGTASGLTAGSVTTIPNLTGDVTSVGNATTLVMSIAHTYTAAQGVNLSSSSAFFVGPNGDTNPTLRVVTNVASAVTGLSVTGNASGSGVTLTALGGTNESITISPKGSGRVILPDGGSVTSPSVVLYNPTPTGFGVTNGNELNIICNSIGIAQFNNATGCGLTMAAGRFIGWRSTTLAAGALPDTAVYRNASVGGSPGVEVNTGTAGVFAGLITGVHVINPPARTSGVAPYLQVITPADTAQTASTEAIGFQIGGTSANPPVTVTRQYGTGALTQHRENLFTAPTLAAVGASTITTAATVAITGAPAQGSGVTITNPYALWVQSGNVLFTGNSSLDQLTVSSTSVTTAANNSNLVLSANDATAKCFSFGVVGEGFVRGTFLASGKISVGPGSATRDTFLERNSTQGWLMTATATTATPLTVKAAASRSVALLQLQTSAGASLGNVGGCIFDDFADTASTHTDGTEDTLATHTTAANTLIINGDKVEARHTVNISGAGNVRLQAYFAGTATGDTGVLTYAGACTVTIHREIIRSSSTTARATVTFTFGAGIVQQPIIIETDLSGLTLTGTNIEKITAIVSTALVTATMKMGRVDWGSEAAA